MQRGRVQRHKPECSMIRNILPEARPLGMFSPRRNPPSCLGSLREWRGGGAMRSGRHSQGMAGGEVRGGKGCTRGHHCCDITVVTSGLWFTHCQPRRSDEQNHILPMLAASSQISRHTPVWSSPQC